MAALDAELASSASGRTSSPASAGSKQPGGQQLPLASGKGEPARSSHRHGLPAGSLQLASACAATPVITMPAAWGSWPLATSVQRQQISADSRAESARQGSQQPGCTEIRSAGLPTCSLPTRTAMASVGCPSSLPGQPASAPHRFVSDRPESDGQARIAVGGHGWAPRQAGIPVTSDHAQTAG